MSNSMSPGDGLSVDSVVEITVSATEGLDPCRIFSDSLDESCRQLDLLLPRMRQQAESLYQCRRQMHLKQAAAAGDHTEATSLEAAIVNLEMASIVLISQYRELSQERRTD